MALSESARMNSAAEARFRVQTQPATNRVVRVIDLDSASGREVARFVADLDGVDLVVILVSAGIDADAASAIGMACSDRRIMTHTIIIGAPSATDAAISATLAQVRPWSLMVVVVNGRDYVDDILRSFR